MIDPKNSATKTKAVIVNREGQAKIEEQLAKQFIAERTKFFKDNSAERPQLEQACRYLVKNSGTSESPEFTRQRDKYAFGALAVLVPLDLDPSTGSKSALPTD
jgi:hypothetical protein